MTGSSKACRSVNQSLIIHTCTHQLYDTAYRMHACRAHSTTYVSTHAIHTNQARLCRQRIHLYVDLDPEHKLVLI